MGDDVRKLVADNEAATILSLLEKTSLSNSEGPDAVAAVLAAGLSEGATSDIVFRLGQKLSESAARPTTPGTAAQATPSGPTPGETTPGKAAPGGTVQNFESCLHFFPASVWQNTRTAGSVEPMVNLCLRLGLRKPSPYTCQVLSCASQLHYKGLEACTAMDQDSRTREVHLVAKMIKRKADKLPAPTVWLNTLPASPVELAAHYRDLFDTVYVDGPPVQLAVSPMELELIRTETRCRFQKGSAAARAPAQVLVPTMPAGMEQLGNTMLQHMQHMQLQQQQLQNGGNGRMSAGTLRLGNVRAAIADQSPQKQTALEDQRAPQDRAPTPWKLDIGKSEGPQNEESGDEKVKTQPAPGPSAPKRARISVEEASKMVLEGYITKDGPASGAASGSEAAKVSKNPLGLMRWSRGLSSRLTLLDDSTSTYA